MSFLFYILIRLIFYLKISIDCIRSKLFKQIFLFLRQMLHSIFILLLSNLMDPSISQYSLLDEPHGKIQVTVLNPTQVKTTLSSYTTYQIKGSDKNGEFDCTRRYSEFDVLRQYLLTRWPGCFIPSLPEKKIVGKNQINFVQNRKSALDKFLKDLSQLPHLWYSEQFEIFLRKGDVENTFKSLPQKDDIIKRYDQKFLKLRGKSIDTNLISKVLDFNKYLKRVQPLLAAHKQFLLAFTEIKNNNYDQYSILFNYVLPQYQKTCLSNYLDQKTQGKVIFSDEQDERFGKFVNQIKQIISKQSLDKILAQIQQQQRDIIAFLDVYKQHAVYEKKIGELREKQKDLEIQQQKLNMGKQSLLKSLFKSNIEDNKRDVERELTINKQFISTYSLLSDLITLILGYFEIDRFKLKKVSSYKKTLVQVAKLQVQFARVRKQLCNHILDNHNLI